MNEFKEREIGAIINTFSLIFEITSEDKIYLNESKDIYLQFVQKEKKGYKIINITLIISKDFHFSIEDMDIENLKALKSFLNNKLLEFAVEKPFP